MAYLVKDPADAADYGLDWTRQLNGDTILTSAWAVEPTGSLTLGAEANTVTSTSVFLAGGTDGEDYALENTIATAGGRTFQRSVIIRVRDVRV
jgi:hypothetical protein